jgi:hypothetical protein
MRISQLKIEIKILEIMKRQPGFTKLHWCGRVQNSNAMVIDLLGPNLEVLCEKYRRFSIKTVVLLTD